MKAFIPRGNTRNRQAVTHKFPEIHGSTLPDGLGMRQTPIVHGGALPDGTELRQMPIIYGG
ncbi:MAG: hypothetical protein ACRDP5_09190 [Streptosporangiaceae bacterium]